MSLEGLKERSRLVGIKWQFSSTSRHVYFVRKENTNQEQQQGRNCVASKHLEQMKGQEKPLCCT